MNLSQTKSNPGEYPVIGFLNKDKLAKLENSIGVKISNPGIFEQALLHRSYLQVLGNPKSRSNERLEFLGDALLGLIAAEYLYFEFNQCPEGELTRLRSRMVNKYSLAKFGSEIEISGLMMLSYNAEKSLSAGNKSILADAVESLIAAIYLDSGFDSAKKFVIEKIFPVLFENKFLEDKNYKSRLLESVQAEGFEAPVYKVEDEYGPEHNREFVVSVFVNGQMKGTGKGSSKKEAEQSSARSALENFFNS